MAAVILPVMVAVRSTDKSPFDVILSAATIDLLVSIPFSLIVVSVPDLVIVKASLISAALSTTNWSFSVVFLATSNSPLAVIFSATFNVFVIFVGFLATTLSVVSSMPLVLILPPIVSLPSLSNL